MMPVTILDRAKQGEPQAIAAFLNHQFSGQGLRIRARHHAEQLEVLVEADTLPDGPNFTTQIHQVMAELAPASIHRVKLYGKVLNEQQPQWVHGFSLPPGPKLSVDPTPTLPTHQAPPTPPPSSWSNPAIKPSAKPKPQPSSASFRPSRHRPPRKLPLGIVLVAIFLLLQIVIITIVLVKAQPFKVAAKPQQPAITMPGVADSAEIQLAKHLKQIGAKMYGTYWCGVCDSQKRLFGEAAFAQVDYVECDPRGTNPRPDLCSAAGIHAYPTWLINGNLYVGGYSLDRLAEISTYSGSRNFVNRYW